MIPLIRTKLLHLALARDSIILTGQTASWDKDGYRLHFITFVLILLLGPLGCVGVLEADSHVQHTNFGWTFGTHGWFINYYWSARSII